MSTAAIFDNNQTPACLSVWCSAKTDCQRKDRCRSAGEFKIAWNNICIDTVRKSAITHTQAWEGILPPPRPLTPHPANRHTHTLRSGAKSNVLLCQAGCVIKIVTAGLFSETKYVTTEFNARMWLVLMIMIFYVTLSPDFFFSNIYYKDLFSSFGILIRQKMWCGLWQGSAEHLLNSSAITSCQVLVK